MELLCMMCSKVVTGPHYARPEAPAFMHQACRDAHLATLDGDDARADAFIQRWGELIP